MSTASKKENRFDEARPVGSPNSTTTLVAHSNVELALGSHVVVRALLKGFCKAKVTGVVHDGKCVLTSGSLTSLKATSTQLWGAALFGV